MMPKQLICNGNDKGRFLHHNFHFLAGKWVSNVDFSVY
jgi:hypothetical protein